MRIVQIDEYNCHNPFAKRLWQHTYGEACDDSPEDLSRIADKMPGVIFRPIQ